MEGEEPSRLQILLQGVRLMEDSSNVIETWSLSSYESPRIPLATIAKQTAHGVRCSCAILSGKVFLSQQQQDSSSSSDNVGDSSSASSTASAAAVNSHVSLDLVPILDQSLLPKSLTIADLSPVPMHGSCLRVAYQGVPDASSAKKISVQERRITGKAWSQDESSS
ncbi:hypothetical protein QJS10_CPA02g00975 [Acorus calamus]|uniref:Uncharacterized protein n=1 Tax=Acorus calamus TaxID=4465 RepID=A0AAV9FDT3_ACOCL|nr:hypothetical protein QJS10_CPA02g00975 [Acorus calamus]